MSLKVVALSGLSTLGAGAVGVGGYIALSGVGSTETKKSTGNQRLLNSGYTYNPPKFTSHKNLDHGCSDNIFKEEAGFQEGKLYGCGVARLDLYDSGDQFKDKGKEEPIEYLAFNSEISLRKGNKGWKINTRFDNHSSIGTVYKHFITTYKKEDNNKWAEEDTLYFSVKEWRESQASINFKKDDGDYEIYLGREELTIKVPGESGDWYKNKGFFSLYRKKVGFTSPPIEDLKKNFKGTKSWSGIWVEEEGERSQWIFEDIEIFMTAKKYSQFFCKENGERSCWQSDVNQIFRQGNHREGSLGTWEYEGYRHNDLVSSGMSTETKIRPIINEIQSSKGKWVNSNDFCKFGEQTDISEEQFEDLKMFCAKSK